MVRWRAARKSIWPRFWCGLALACGAAGGDFAALARAYHNEATSEREKAGAAVIDDTMAERMVACGWIAAVINAALTVLTLAIILSRQQTRSLLPLLSLVDVGFLLALAYGIYRRSRACAIVVLAYLPGLDRASLLGRARARAPAFDGADTASGCALRARRDRHVRASCAPPPGGGIAVPLTGPLICWCAARTRRSSSCLPRARRGARRIRR